MNAQLSLVYSPATEGRKDFLEQVEILQSAIAYLGLKDVAFELDIGGSYLSDALKERERKRWAAEWTFVIKRMLSKRADMLAMQLLRNLVECELAGTDLELKAGDDDLTDDEMKAALAAVAAVRRKKKRGER